MKIDAHWVGDGAVNLKIDLGGDGALQRAAAIGLNEHSQHQKKRSTTFISAWTGIGAGRVGSGMRVIPAVPGAVMETSVAISDRGIPAGEHTSRSWNRSMPGATHGDWPGRGKRILAHTFTVRRWGGRIYARTTAARFPLKRIWGPYLPNELTAENRPNLDPARAFAVQDAMPRVLKQIMRVTAP